MARLLFDISSSGDETMSTLSLEMAAHLWTELIIRDLWLNLRNNEGAGDIT